MRNAITRPKYEREGSGYSSDPSDQEWARIQPRRHSVSVWGVRQRRN